MGTVVGMVAALGCMVGCGRAAAPPTEEAPGAGGQPDNGDEPGSAGGRADEGCRRDGDCNAGQLCRVHDGTCVACLEDSDCASGEMCSGGACSEASEPAPVLCAPGARTCNGPDVEACSADGTELVKQETCALTQVCSGGSCHDIQCVPNHKLCRDNQIWSCASDGVTAELVKACKTDQFCLEDDGDASCSTTTCTAGSPLCNGDVATKCRPDGSGPEPAGQDCNSAGELCYQGECRERACTAGQKLCDHGDVYLCAEAGTSTVLFTQCAEDEACDITSGSCRPRICEPGKHTCDGSQTAECNELGTGWEAQTDCAATGLLCDAGSCKPKICTPNRATCKDGDVYQCDGLGLSASLVQVCAANQYCGPSPYNYNQEACLPDICTPGAPTCRFGYLAACNADGSGQVLDGGALCADGQVCAEDGKSCTSAVCVPNTAFCFDGDVYYCPDALKKTLAEDCGETRYCRTDGQWTHCVPYDCQPGKTACLGNQIGACGGNGLALSSVSANCAVQGQVCTAQLSCAQTSIDTFGATTDIQTYSDGDLVGDFVDVLSARTLTQLEVKLNLPVARDVSFQVYAVDPNGRFLLEMHKIVYGLVGDGYIASPTLDYSLQAGTRYFFGVVVTGGSFGVYLDSVYPYTVTAALGRQAGRMSAHAVPYPPVVVEGPYAMLYDIRLTTTAP